MINKRLRSVSLGAAFTIALGFCQFALAGPVLNAVIVENGFDISISLDGTEDSIDVLFSPVGSGFIQTTIVVDPNLTFASIDLADTTFAVPFFNRVDGGVGGQAIARLGTATKSDTMLQGAFGVLGGTYTSGTFPLAQLRFPPAAVPQAELQIRVTRPGGNVILDTFAGAATQTGPPISITSVPEPTSFFCLLLISFISGLANAWRRTRTVGGKLPR